MSEETDQLISRGFQARRENRPTDALQAFTKAADLSRDTDDQLSLAHALTGLGQIERDLGNNDSALQHYKAAVAIYRKQNDPFKLAHAVRHLGDILRNEKLYEESRLSYEEALEIYRQHETTNALDLANTLRGFAMVSSELHDRDRSKALWLEAQGLYERVNVKAGADECAANLSRFAG